MLNINVLGDGGGHDGTSRIRVWAEHETYGWEINYIMYE